MSSWSGAATAYRLMQELKDLFDPDGLLNPGVILNQDPEIHVKNFKPMPAVDPAIDRCIECGFCEPICPSRDLSLTPRQRIVILREQARLRAEGADDAALARLADQFAWLGEGTCAADGLCATRCPVGIDTGAVMKKLRVLSHGDLSKRVAHWVDGHMAGVTAATRTGLALAHGVSRLTGPVPLEALTNGMRRLSGDRVPTWHRWMPRAGSHPKTNGKPPKGAPPAADSVVYFSACVNRSMGTASCDSDARDLREVMTSLLAKAGLTMVTPAQVDRLCCGQPFASKGYERSAETAVRRLEDALWQASDQGRWPVLCDTSPCTARMLEQFTRPLRVQEPVAFIEEHLIPRLRQTRKRDQIALHITCSARKMGLDETFKALAERCAERVFQAEEEGCCGFAGDKGFSAPDLNASALAGLAAQLPADCEDGYSNSRTCEIGLARHTGIPYRSIAYLVDECFERLSDESKEETPVRKEQLAVG